MAHVISQVTLSTDAFSVRYGHLDLFRDVDLEVTFPARNQSRTALQVVLRISREEAAGKRFDGELFHHVQLVGEVIEFAGLREKNGLQFGQNRTAKIVAHEFCLALVQL